jgi:hypothetical protein
MNNDGYTDIIYSGIREGSGYISKVALFDPTKRLFEEQLQFSFGDYQSLNVEFGDFDADNDLDILLNGKEKTTNRDLFLVYKNVQNESASIIQSINSGGKANLISSNEFNISSRMNNLFNLDISSASNNNVLISKFNENRPPTTPANLKESVLRKIQFKYRVSFNWGASNDDKTPITGLTYELRVGTTPGASDVVVSSSMENGFKLIPEEGNVGRNKTWEIDLPAGRYYWSVQAIDASLAGSPFATERSFNITSTGGICNIELPTASVIGNKTFICNGDTAILKSSVSGGIQWFKDDVPLVNATDSLLKITTFGNYKLIKNVSGCSSGFSNILNIQVRPLPASGTVSFGTVIPCEGSNLLLTATSDSVVAWYKDNILISGKIGKTFNATTSGSYSIVSNSSNGCSSVKSTPLLVNFKPVPNSDVTLSNKSICEGTKTTLSVKTGTNYFYQWSKDGVDITGATSSTYITGDSGIYKAKVSLDGCNSISNGDTLKVYSIPKTPSLTSSSSSACEGTKIDLTSSVTPELRWFKDTSLISGIIGNVYSVSTSGSYSVSAVLNNCISPKSNSINITIKPLPKSLVTLSNKSICAGTQTTLSVQPGTNYIYQWSRNGIEINGATDATYLASDSGIYKAKVTLDDCSSISLGDTLKVYSIPTKPSITKDTTQIVSSSPVGNQWYLDGKIIPGATEQRFRPSVQGSYTVLINLNNCESPISDSYYFLTTAIVNLSDGQYIKAYPNPVHSFGNLTIDWNIGGNNNKLKLQVFNIVGKLVLNKEISKNDNKIQIPGASGLYTIKLTYNKIQTSIIRIYKN